MCGKRAFYVNDVMEMHSGKHLVPFKFTQPIKIIFKTFSFSTFVQGTQA